MKKTFLLCTDSNQDSYSGMLNTIKSLEYTNPGIPITIFCNSLTDDQLLNLKNYNLIQVDNFIDNSTYRPDLGFGNYYRFYFNILTEFEKVVYLDTDVIVLESLTNMFEINSEVAAVGRLRDISDDFLDHEKLQRDKLIEDKFWAFNTGVICFDINFWRDIDLISSVGKYINEYGLKSFKNPVNCLMYLITKEYCGFYSLPKHYNFTVNSLCDGIEINRQGLLSPVVDNDCVKVLHWNGIIKYWHNSTLKGFSQELILKMEKEGFDYDYIFEKYYPCVDQFLTPNGLSKPPIMSPY